MRSRLATSSSPSGDRVSDENLLSTWPPRLIVSAVLFAKNAWHQRRKAIVLAGSVLFAVSCLLLLLLNKSQSCSDLYGGWMWQAECCAALGRPIGVGNTSKCSYWQKFPGALLLHPALLAPYVRITVGVGMIDLHATLGGDHRNCVSLLLVFLLFSLVTNTGGICSQRNVFHDRLSSL